MKVYENLSDIVEYIKRKHSSFLNKKSLGVECCKFVRTKKGRRIPFETSRGFRIFEMEANEEFNQIHIEQLALGLTMKGQHKCTMSSILTLSNLQLINVYDYMTEFYSVNGIDFTYIHNCSTNQDAVAMRVLHEWINGDPGIVRACWLPKNTTLDKIEEELGLRNDYNDDEEFMTKARLLT